MPRVTRRLVAAVESVEARVLCDGAPGPGVNDEGPVMTMGTPEAPGPGTDLTFTPDPEPTAGPGWTIGWVDTVQELQVELLGPSPVPPVNPLD